MMCKVQYNIHIYALNLILLLINNYVEFQHMYKHSYIYVDFFWLDLVFETGAIYRNICLQIQTHKEAHTYIYTRIYSLCKLSWFYFLKKRISCKWSPLRVCRSSVLEHQTLGIFPHESALISPIKWIILVFMSLNDCRLLESMNVT